MNKETLQTLLERPIAFHPIFARVAGSVKAGLFLSQLFYWNGKEKNEDGWIYKTQPEWREETCLTREEQESARTRLRNRKFLLEKRTGNPARLHYKIGWDALIPAIESLQSSLRESRNLDSGKAADKNGQIQQSSIAETTTETTTENTPAPPSASPSLNGTSERETEATGKPEKAPPPPPSDHQKLMSLYWDTGKKLNGVPPLINGAQGKAAQRYLEHHKLEDVSEWMLRQAEASKIKFSGVTFDILLLEKNKPKVDKALAGIKRLEDEVEEELGNNIVRAINGELMTANEAKKLRESLA